MARDCNFCGSRIIDEGPIVLSVSSSTDCERGLRMHGKPFLSLLGEKSLLKSRKIITLRDEVVCNVTISNRIEGRFS